MMHNKLYKIKSSLFEIIKNSYKILLSATFNQTLLTFFAYLY